MIIAYTRGSTAKQTLTIGAQRDRALMYGKLNDIEISEVIEDKAASSRKPLGKRPGGRWLENLIKTGGITGVIISRLDRAFRSTAECLETVERWQKKGVALHVLDFGGTALNTKSSTGKLILTVFAAIAEWERMIISERTAEAMAHNRANGKLTTRPDRVRYGCKVNADKTVVEDHGEQEIIRSILFMHRSEGRGAVSIAKGLMELKVKMRGKDKWHPNTITRIIKRAVEDGQ